MKEYNNKKLDCRKNWVRLPLQNAHNVRELGGYPVVNGGQTAYHRFLRADDISTLTDYDVEFLYEYGVRMVIDLRSDAEAIKAPDRLCGVDGVEYVRIPFLSKDVTDAIQVTQRDIEIGLSAMYSDMLENKETIRRIFTAVEEAPEGCILFHCSAGKDRTGVMAMLLMSLAGADKQDCITNYAQSYTNLTRKAELVAMCKQPGYENYLSLMYSLPETISEIYDLIIEKHDSVESYLKYCGLKDEQIAGIRKRLLED